MDCVASWPLLLAESLLTLAASLSDCGITSGFPRLLFDDVAAIFFCTLVRFVCSLAMCFDDVDRALLLSLVASTFFSLRVRFATFTAFYMAEN